MNMREREEHNTPNFERMGKSNPFKTPDHYFDTFEDRVMAGIHHQEKTKTKSSRAIQYLKPVLGLVASFTIVYLLVYYPINHFFPKTLVKSETSEQSSQQLPDAYALSFSLLDENTLFRALTSDEEADTSSIDQDDILAYLSTEFNDIEIFAEIQN